MKGVTLNAAGARLRYLEFAGRGSPLLMIHGLGCASSFDYPHVARAKGLRARHTILVDLPGFGFSDRPDAFDYSVSGHARSVATLIAARQFGSVSLYGHSMGGSVAVELADLLGTQVDGLVLSEANLDSGGGLFSRAIAEMGEDAYIRHGHEETIGAADRQGNHAWAATMRSALPGAVFQGARSLVRGGSPPWRQRFEAHPAPRAFIIGERSAPEVDMSALAKAGVRVATVSEAGHSMALDNPDGLAEAVAAALP